MAEPGDLPGDRSERADDLEISLGPPSSRPLPRREPPDRRGGVALAAVGGPARRGLRIYVSRRAWEAAETHAASDTLRELGGVLLGSFSDDAEGLFLDIEDVLPAESTDSRAARITFTHETWDRLLDRCEARGDDLQIVGWYHTHPGFGIFLSEHDLFIHRHFFAEAWHVALVIDPVAGERGMFRWEAGTVRPAAGWYLYADAQEAESVTELAHRLTAGPVRPTVPAAPALRPEDLARVERRLENVRSYVLLLTVAALLILSVNLVLLMSLSRLTAEMGEVRRLAERGSPLGRGRDLVAVGRFDEALGELTLARLDPDAAAEADYQLHRAYERLGRHDDARSAIIQAGRRDPERYSRAHAAFVAADLKRGTDWTTATQEAPSQVRLAALRQATDARDTAAGRVAAAALHDADAEVVLAGVKVLRALPGPEARRSLTDFVARTREDAQTRFEDKEPAAAAALMDLARAADPDDPAAEDDSWFYRYKAGLSTLSEILDQAGVFRRVAEDVFAPPVLSDARTRRRVVRALGRQRGDWPREVLVSWPVWGDRAVRDEAIDSLVLLSIAGDWHAADFLGAELQNIAEVDYRDRLIDALGRTKQAIAAPALVALLQGKGRAEDEHTRIRALRRLAELGRPGADAIEHVLSYSDDSEAYRRAVAEAKAVAQANALYDTAYNQYDAGELDAALRTLNSIETGVSGDRSVRWLRRQVRRAIAARDARSRAAGGVSQSRPQTGSSGPPSSG